MTTYFTDIGITAALVAIVALITKAVSYTHLDDVINVIVLCVLILPAIVNVVAIVIFSKAVSYTHLDVYKRQGRNFRLPISARWQEPETLEECFLIRWHILSWGIKQRRYLRLLFRS